MVDANQDSHQDSHQESGSSQELTLEQALGLGLQMHQQRHFEDAEKLYLRIIETWPGSPDAWHLLGMLRFHQDKESVGIQCLRKAVELHPEFPDAHANLGNMLLNRGLISEASHHLHVALRLRPEAFQPRVALAALFRALGRLELAEKMLSPALETEAGRNSAAVHNGLGNVYESQGRNDDAIDSYRTAQELSPDLGFARARLGMMLAYTGRLEEAALVFQKRLEIEPDDAEAQHMLASCGGAPTPARANDAYVKSTFDNFASSFDSKLESLEYRAPELIDKLMRQTLPAPSRTLNVADTGCGTGLLGERIRPFCSQLIGVDLSPGMMARARSRQVYDELVESELGAYLDSNPDQFDVVTSADTFCYIGDVATVILSAAKALRPGGWLFFSVEHGVDLESDFHLQFHGRYAHKRSYIEQSLKTANFSRAELLEDTLRMELSKPVPGLIVAAQLRS